jgi:hypothetical protein
MHAFTRSFITIAKCSRNELSLDVDGGDVGYTYSTRDLPTLTPAATSAAAQRESPA